ncbi:19118_t:CDS:2 [Cetraspora pellucida]|uniref:19118_t:CDS:1 n=1 Tax=Cetraspora pellucida TaxID=1433469 RepID=A0A9N9ITX2_9GLOM|nr:19118_t:CDS:2 [Cetraspora pellucida]
MQLANLAAFVPLFPAARKSKYAICSVNLTSEGHYFDFDEVLETYRVKFVKQNITNNITIQETMMLKIKSHKDSFWSLVANLLSTFDHPNPTTYYLFEDVPEFSKEGIENLLSFYETEKLCFQEMLEEDVYKTKCQTSKYNQIDNSIQESIDQQDTLILQQTLSLSSSATNPFKYSCCITTEAEKTILAQLFKLGDSDIASENKIKKVLSELLTISSDWTEKRVKQY